MRVNFDKRTVKEINTYTMQDRAKIDHVVNLFIEQGFALNEQYLKKLAKNLWELRAGKIRVLLGIVENEVIIVNTFYKKTNKTPLKEIKTAEKRIESYL